MCGVGVGSACVEVGGKNTSLQLTDERHFLTLGEWSQSFQSHRDVTQDIPGIECALWSQEGKDGASQTT